MTGKTKIAYVFPGQGSQRVGMGRDLYDNISSAKAVFDQADQVLGIPLTRLCLEGPEDELRQTVNAQPALVTVSFACLQAAREIIGDNLPLPSFIAGHSLGEYTALAAAGVLDFATTVHLARERGKLMHEASLLHPGNMAAIIGLDETLLSDVCHQTDTRIANINCPGQLVISGSRENLMLAIESAKARGARRAVPLQVSGAFHTSLMQLAADGLSKIIATISFQEPGVPIIGNTTAQPLITAESIKTELLNQLCNCVQWQRSIEYMLNDGVSTFIEIGPGKVLSGLIKRIHKGNKTININDLPSIKGLLNSSHKPLSLTKEM